MTASHAETQLREQFAARARELGSEPQPDTLRLKYADVPGLPDCRLVAGTWSSGPSRSGVAGLVCRGERADLQPGHALVSLLTRWQAAPAPSAAAVAACVAFLVDPLEMRVPLLAEADVRGWRTLEGGQVSTPSVVTEHDGGRVVSIRFWWEEDGAAQEVVVDIDAEERVAIGGGRTAVRDARGVDGGRP